MEQPPSGTDGWPQCSACAWRTGQDYGDRDDGDEEWQVADQDDERQLDRIEQQADYRDAGRQDDGEHQADRAEWPAEQVGRQGGQGGYWDDADRRHPAVAYGPGSRQVPSMAGRFQRTLAHGSPDPYAELGVLA